MSGRIDFYAGRAAELERQWPVWNAYGFVGDKCISTFGLSRASAVRRLRSKMARYKPQPRYVALTTGIVTGRRNPDQPIPPEWRPR